ncbi:MAG: hypothetical protein HQ518_10510 [Rhodopirellula sp.]|nr:hypothetical protein [Rhodopirellula sp.]
MSSADKNGDSNDIVRQQAEAEEQIAQLEDEARRKRRSERRGCLGCAVIVAVPVVFFIWRIISIGLGMVEAGKFERKVAVIGGRVTFTGGDDMGRGLGVKGVSTISITREDFSDEDMLKLAPLLEEAESFRHLYLGRSSITDEGLQYIPDGVKLEMLNCLETDVTKAGIDRLLLRLPHLRNSLIRFDGGDVKNGIVSPPHEFD